MIAVVDYGVGNLFSLRGSLQAIGAQSCITGDPREIASASHVILPGVGAFADAANKLRSHGLDQAILSAARQGKPLLGICLGMQMLFDESLEYGVHAGLGLLRGQVAPMEGALPQQLKIPHIGWNALQFQPGCSPILKNVKPGDCVYFVHSYFASGCDESLLATAEYGIPIPAVVGRDNIFGCQFHPEKSGRVGLEILRAFCELEGAS